MKERVIKGKKVLLVTDHEIIAAKGYSLYSQKRGANKWEKYAKIKDTKKAFFSHLRITSRLLRAELNKLYILPDGCQLCIARKGIFRKTPESKVFTKCFKIPRGSRPMNICYDEDSGKLYFGEYFTNYEKIPVHIYCSEDMGLTWNIVYTFEEGMINHIHGIYKDPYTRDLWVATGDRVDECIIGHTSDGFKTLDIVVRGGQDYRTCVLFFYQDYVIFATDSQYQECFIKKIDRKTHEIETIQPVQGPVIRGVECGDLAIICTDVEPTEVHKDKHAYIWYSYDGLNWKVLYREKKDCLSAKYFQFGTFDLPYYLSDKTDFVYATGKALRHCDGDTIVFPIDVLMR